jgi:hypothetical protein
MYFPLEVAAFGAFAVANLAAVSMLVCNEVLVCNEDNCTLLNMNQVLD